MNLVARPGEHHQPCQPYWLCCPAGDGEEAKRDRATSRLRLDGRGLWCQRCESLSSPGDSKQAGPVSRRRKGIIQQRRTRMNPHNACKVHKKPTITLRIETFMSTWANRSRDAQTVGSLQVANSINERCKVCQKHYIRAMRCSEVATKLRNQRARKVSWTETLLYRHGSRERKKVTKLNGANWAVIVVADVRPRHAYSASSPRRESTERKTRGY